ncbi:SurA N-terminal domain-containing protein, partial [Patescibacteria group bacterium]|nr:SurA N-terminal domain-containing protein [Patescibacteria group bacterium]
MVPFAKVNNLLDKVSILKNFRSSKKFYIILIIAGVLLLAVFKKGWFVAAMVNGTPITNLELQMKLNQQFRTQILNQLVNEKIIAGEARKNGAIPTQTEIDSKIAELEENVGGKDVLDSMLAQQGQTRTDLKDQIWIQLAITKLYDKEATVSADEVTNFIVQNKDQLQSTDSAKQQQEAYDILKNQKLS